MTLSNLPDWLPWWVPILVLIPLGIWALAMLVLPFSVVGVKSRLEGIEARLDEIQAEIRSLVLRLPEADTYLDRRYDTAPQSGPADRSMRTEPRPPIPPAARPPAGIVARRPDGLRAERPVASAPTPAPRAEPRLDWRP